MKIPLLPGPNLAIRTWVSGVGDDANPCSRVEPCRTFAGAILKTTPGGEISTLDIGAFGSVSITKSITIDGGNGLNEARSTSSTIVVDLLDVNAGGGNVNIRNLSIEASLSNSEFGITYRRAKSLAVENCSLKGFKNAGINVDLNRHGILLVWDTAIRNSATGIRLDITGGRTLGAQINNCVLSDQDTGIDVRAGTAIISNSRIMNNRIAGISTGGTVKTTVSIVNCDVEKNGNGIVVATPKANVEINDSRVFGNAVGLLNIAGGIVKTVNIKFFGNNIDIRRS